MSWWQYKHFDKNNSQTQNKLNLARQEQNEDGPRNQTQKGVTSEGGQPSDPKNQYDFKGIKLLDLGVG